MTVYYDHNLLNPEPRLHPYSAAKRGESGQIDFKQHPELIRTELEDFRPFNSREAIQRFYEMLKWINVHSQLETNDCALRPPSAHRDGNSNLALCIHGRLCIQYRHLPFNSSPQHADWLCRQTMATLSSVDEEFPANQGVVGFTRNPIIQTTISKGRWVSADNFQTFPGDPGKGELLMLSFWAYGDNGDEAFTNLCRVFSNIWTACRSVSAEIEKATKQES